MKKFEVYGKSYKKAYRRNCAKKKFKQRARKWESFFSYERKGDDGPHYLSWGEIWHKIEKGEWGCWLRTTGKPCSCVMCSPIFMRDKKQDILKQAWKEILDEAEDSTLED